MRRRLPPEMLRGALQLLIKVVEMKLSMWMIVNRLYPLLEMEPDIRDDAPQVLNSARLAYSTNCLHVYQEKDYIVYAGEGGTIRLFNLSLKEAFEIVQGVFDYYQDLEDDIRKAVMARNYQKAVDELFLIFHNPMMVTDGNNQMLAMTSPEDVDDSKMDPEWNYVRQYGYSSVNSVRAFWYNRRGQNFLHHGFQTFDRSIDSRVKYGGVSYCLEFNAITCGRIVLLEAEREINYGDYQLIEMLAQLLEPVLGSVRNAMQQNINIFYNLIFQMPYSEKYLLKALADQNWSVSDSYQLILMQTKAGFTRGAYLDVLYRTALNQPHGCIVLRKEPHIIFLTNKGLSENTQLRQFLIQFQKSNPVLIGCSLEVRGIETIPFLYEQAEYALIKAEESQAGTDSGKDTGEKDAVFYFADYGAQAILESNVTGKYLHALHPLVVRLWTDYQKDGDSSYETLRTFLDCERSITQTAAKLYTHRNTIIYRLKKIQDLLGDGLDNSETRFYIRLSMYLIEMNEDRPIDD